MTTKELIEQLQNLPQDMDVCILANGIMLTDMDIEVISEKSWLHEYKRSEPFIYIY